MNRQNARGKYVQNVEIMSGTDENLNKMIIHNLDNHHKYVFTC